MIMAHGHAMPVRSGEASSGRMDLSIGHTDIDHTTLAIEEYIPPEIMVLPQVSWRPIHRTIIRCLKSLHYLAGMFIKHKPGFDTALHVSV